MNNRPLLAITLGDPAGIGPEVIVKALRHADVYEQCRPLVLGDQRILVRAMSWIREVNLTFDVVTDPDQGQYQSGVITLLDLQNADPVAIQPGRVSAAAGRAAVEYVLRACDMTMAGETDAVVTAPLNKEEMNLAGYH
jgi:4-hydroxythreonine-4-phosphate dehydrogenase